MIPQGFGTLDMDEKNIDPRIAAHRAAMLLELRALRDKVAKIRSRIDHLNADLGVRKHDQDDRPADFDSDRSPS